MSRSRFAYALVRLRHKHRIRATVLRGVRGQRTYPDQNKGPNNSKNQTNKQTARSAQPKSSAIVLRKVYRSPAAVPTVSRPGISSTPGYTPYELSTHLALRRQAALAIDPIGQENHPTASGDAGTNILCPKLNAASTMTTGTNNFGYAIFNDTAANNVAAIKCTTAGYTGTSVLAGTSSFIAGVGEQVSTFAGSPAQYGQFGTQSGAGSAGVMGWQRKSNHQAIEITNVTPVTQRGGTCYWVDVGDASINALDINGIEALVQSGQAREVPSTSWGESGIMTFHPKLEANDFTRWSSTDFPDSRTSVDLLTNVSNPTLALAREANCAFICYSPAGNPQSFRCRYVNNVLLKPPVSTVVTAGSVYQPYTRPGVPFHPDVLAVHSMAQHAYLSIPPTMRGTPTSHALMSNWFTRAFSWAGRQVHAVGKGVQRIGERVVGKRIERKIEDGIIAGIEHIPFM